MPAALAQVITVKDFFFGMAMAGLLANPARADVQTKQRVVDARLFAELMLKQRLA